MIFCRLLVPVQEVQGSGRGSWLVALYFKEDDSRIVCICNDKYTTMLEMLNKTSDIQEVPDQQDPRMLPALQTRRACRSPCTGSPPLPAPAPGVPALQRWLVVHRRRVCRTTTRLGGWLDASRGLSRLTATSHIACLDVSDT